jgi:shikimate dehydrogenase
MNMKSAPAVSGKTRLYAILGDPVTHVRTPMVFNDRFRAEAIDAVCVPMHVHADNLRAMFDGLRALENLDGFIITAPHKQAAVALCDEVLDEGRLVGAVNTVRREPGGRLVADLFDGTGFVEGLRQHGWDPEARRIFLMGAGGAGNALAFALARAGAAAITIHNRTTAKSEALARRVQAAYPHCKVHAGPREPRGHDIAINATPVGISPGDPPAFDVSTLSPQALVADVIMIPEMTTLLAAARAHGCSVHLGRHMLDHQVELMFRFMG